MAEEPKPVVAIPREKAVFRLVVGAFTDGNSALMLVSARLRRIAGTRWGTWRYLDMKKLTEMEKEEEVAA